MGLVQILSRINGYRKSLKEHYLIEKVFEIFYKKYFNIDAESLNKDIIHINDSIKLGLIDKEFLVDVTFDKYIKDNIDRISNYDKYYKESFYSYLKSYEELNNKNDPTDI